MKLLRVAVRTRDREALAKQLGQLVDAGHQIVSWQERAQADTNLSLGTDGLLQIKAKRKKMELPFDASTEDLVFWINELSYTGKRPAGSRATLELDVELAYETTVARTRTVDLSSSGLFIRSVAPPPLGAVVGVVLHLDDGAGPLRALGQVVHVVSAKDSALGDESGTPRIAHPGVAVDLVGLSPLGKQRMARRVASAIAQRQQMR